MPDLLIKKKRIPWGHLLLLSWLPSPLKVWVYRTFLGYRIGRRVKLGLGSVVVGREVELADDVEIGFLAVIQGRTITIGRHSSVGTMSYVSCNRIELGEDARIREQVYVGGPQLPESRFTLGSRTIVLQMAYINPTKPVTIGDDSGIGGHCLIFTHGSWLSALEGYPVTYEPVTIGASVWLPWRVFVMPGATIGDGSVIGANSLVSGNIPPSSLAAGTPAKVLRSAPDFPRTLTPAQREAKIDEMLSEFDRFVADEGVVRSGEADDRRYSIGGRTWRLVRARAGGQLPDGLVAGDTTLTDGALPGETRARFRASGVHYIDLGQKLRSEAGSPLTEELAVFLGRYGIRPAREY